MFKQIFLIGLTSLFFFLACKKGDRIEGAHYMKFTLDAFLADTSLFSVVKLNDTTIGEKTGVNAGNIFNIANTGQGLMRTDSARLRVTIVKKNTANVQFDSLIFLNKINDFLLLQLNPTQKPLLINRALENATALQPGKDSIKIRFYYNNLDQIKWTNGRQADSIWLQLYRIEKVTDGEYKAPQKLVLLKNIRINQLGNYISLYDGNPNIKYGFDVLDPRNATTPGSIQKLYWQKEDGILRGTLDYYGNDKFRTIHINKSTKEGEWTFDQYTGFNGDYMFGLN